MEISGRLFQRHRPVGLTMSPKRPPRDSPSPQVESAECPLTEDCIRRELLFELTGTTSLHGQVPRVMRPRSHLIDHKVAIGRHEKLDA